MDWLGIFNNTAASILSPTTIAYAEGIAAAG